MITIIIMIIMIMLINYDNEIYNSVEDNDDGQDNNNAKPYYQKRLHLLPESKHVLKLVNLH